MLRRNEHGFTLIELMIVVLIIGILIAIIIPVFDAIQHRATPQKITSTQALEEMGGLWYQHKLHQEIIEGCSVNLDASPNFDIDINSATITNSKTKGKQLAIWVLFRQRGIDGITREKRVDFGKHSDWVRLNPYVELRVSPETANDATFILFFKSRQHLTDPFEMFHGHPTFELEIRTSREPFRSDMQQARAGQRFL